MSKDDWSIVVGITRYPALPTLQGPENDARAFNEWVLASEGGDVPSEQSRLIVSSDFPEATPPLEADPTDARVEEAFKRLLRLSEENTAAGRIARVGRRLYVYMAGHGLELGLLPEARPVLLTANATKTVPLHVFASSWIESLRLRGAFDETVFLFDACRQRISSAPLRPAPLVEVSEPRPRIERWLDGYAAQVRQKAYERPFDSEPHGVFSRTLLAGLRGAASDENGNVTAPGLSNYVRYHMRHLLDDEERNNPEVNQEPDMRFGDGELILASVPRAESAVEISVKPEAAGKTLRIVGGKLEPIFTKVIAPGEQALTLRLPVGRYLVDVLGGEQGGITFEVRGLSKEEVIHVVF